MNPRESTVVFLGPSLDPNEAAKNLRANYLPPIRRGDLPAAVANGARSIGIVDGEFGQSLAVSVMEVAAALRQGVRIWGAASMGALRAVECQSLGMIGIGWIFQKYSEGSLQADDEVALLFDPLTYRATTIPLVNVRWAVEIAVETKTIPKAAAGGVIELAGKLRFTERTHETLLQIACGSEFEPAMRTLIELMKADVHGTDRKRLDALLLLKTMQESRSVIA